MISELRGDLDWITMKALDRDRERRYATPLELAGDLRRYLDDEPVLARPASPSYRIGWWQLLYFLPVVGWIVLIFFCIEPTQANRYSGEV